MLPSFEVIQLFSFSGLRTGPWRLCIAHAGLENPTNYRRTAPTANELSSHFMRISAQIMCPSERVRVIPLVLQAHKIAGDSLIATGCHKFTCIHDCSMTPCLKCFLEYQ